jgi:hypothetical protein
MDQDFARHRDELRLRLLRAVYERCEGSELRGTPIDDLAELIGASHDELREAMQYLLREDLVRYHGAGALRMMHGGIVEVEAAIRGPGEPTDHFGSGVTLNVNKYFTNRVVGSVQSGGQGDTATVNQSVTNVVSNVEQVLQRLRVEVQKAPPEKQAEAHAYLDALVGLMRQLPKAAASMKVLLMRLQTVLDPSSWPVVQDAISSVSLLLGR